MLESFLVLCIFSVAQWGWGPWELFVTEHPGFLALPSLPICRCGERIGSSSKGTHFHGTRYKFAGRKQSSGWYKSLTSPGLCDLFEESIFLGWIPGNHWPCVQSLQTHGCECFHEAALFRSPWQIWEQACRGDGEWVLVRVFFLWSRHVGHLVLMVTAVYMLGTNRCCFFNFIHESSL